MVKAESDEAKGHVEKYPAGIDKSKFDGYLKFMYVPAAEGGLKIFSLDKKTLETAKQLEYEPNKTGFFPAQVCLDEGLEAECISVDASELEDLAKNFKVRSPYTKDTQDKVLNAAVAKIKESYGGGFLPFEKYAAVFDQDKEFKGLTLLLYIGR
jgi:hypothetical protein